MVVVVVLGEGVEVVAQGSGKECVALAIIGNTRTRSKVSAGCTRARTRLL